MNLAPITTHAERRLRRAPLWGAVLLASALALTACSGGSDDAAAAGGSTVITDAMGPVTEVKAADPFTPPTDKHILIMTCGSAGQGCVDEAAEEKKVAESLGWTVDVVDGKFDPTVWNQTVKNAVDSGVDAIIAISADPNLYSDAMASVAASDIPFVLTEQIPGEEDVEGISTFIAPDPEVGGADIAEWLVADSDGEAHVLILDVPGTPSHQKRTKVIADALEADCPDCVVYISDINPQTMGTSLAPQVTTQLQQHPDIEYVWGADDASASFVQQGIRQAGRTDSVKAMSMTGFAQQMSQVQTGEMAFELSSPTPYTAWLAVDSLARLMAGGSVETYQPIPQRIWTAANIADAPAEVYERGWTVDYDYESMFETAWGLK